MSTQKKLVQQTYTAILEHLVEFGRAPHYTKLAKLLHVDVETAKDLQKQAADVGVGCWLTHKTDYIESWAPFSNLPTHHEVTVDGEQKWYAQ